jgi:hypothetical protein
MVDRVCPTKSILQLFDANGKKLKSVNPILDGSCGTMEDFFALLKEYLLWLNLDDAAEIAFCADGGNGNWLDRKINRRIGLD